jgi:UDP-2,3-diacylglucosamine pyrophosphatase LpxH
MSTVVISDTHFGVSSALLTDPGKVDYLLWEIWRYGGGCEEIVLLGDIFDLWRASPEKALRDSRYFFQRISELDIRVNYVIGNHDHHFAVMSRECEFLQRVSRGEIYPVYIPNLHWSQTINGLSIQMHYPTYASRINAQSCLFTHGHHLDGVQAFSLQVVEKLRKLSGEEITPADLETMMTYTYESIYRSGSIGEIVELEERIWKVSSIFERVRTEILKTFRFTPVERQYPAIMKFIHDQHIEKVDCFIYGDTHRADVYQRGKGPLAINVGCFTGENGKELLPNPEVIPETYLVISEEGICLRQLGRHEPLSTPEHSAL